MAVFSRLIFRHVGELVRDILGAAQQPFALQHDETQSMQAVPQNGLWPNTETPSPLERTLRGWPRPQPRSPAIGNQTKDIREAAEARARRLLLRMLSPEQRAQLQGYGFFCVNVSTRGAFCVLPRRVYNVLDLWTGDCYCCTPGAKIPLSDVMLTQKLLLENDPQQFFSVANRKPDPIIDMQGSGRRARDLES